MPNWKGVAMRPCTKSLIADADIHDAALWRLAKLPHEVIEAATARVAHLIELGTPMESTHPEIVQVLAMLDHPADRREPWTALMAVVALYADSRGDDRLFLLAGFEIVTAWRNSRAKAGGTPRNALTQMMAQYQANQPAAGADTYFELLAGLVGMDPLIADYDSELDVISYDDRGRLRDLSRASFARQFRRVAAKAKSTLPTEQKIFSASSWTQRDVVRNAA